MSTRKLGSIKLDVENRGFYSAIKCASSTSDLNAKIVKIIKELGFSDYTFVPLERDWDHEGNQGVLSSYPAEYWDIYRENRLYKHDMLVSYFRQNIHHTYTSFIYNYYADAPFDNETTRCNKDIRQLQHTYGFLEQYAVPVIDSECNTAFILIIAEQNSEAAAFQNKANSKIPALRELGQAIHKVVTTKFPELFEGPNTKIADIAPKPLRVLATLANNDLSISDVASLLCISPITAHQHIAAARKALKRQTNVGAIKEAIRQGLISYDYDKR